LIPAHKIGLARFWNGNEAHDDGSGQWRCIAAQEVYGISQAEAEAACLPRRRDRLYAEGLKTRLGVQQLVALLGPTITILMGAAIAAIVASLLTAMLSLNNLAE
jgi:hypothetical protein